MRNLARANLRMYVSADGVGMACRLERRRISGGERYRIYGQRAACDVPCAALGGAAGQSGERAGFCGRWAVCGVCGGVVQCGEGGVLLVVWCVMV